MDIVNHEMKIFQEMDNTEMSGQEESDQQRSPAETTTQGIDTTETIVNPDTVDGSLESLDQVTPSIISIEIPTIQELVQANADVDDDVTEIPVTTACKRVAPVPVDEQIAAKHRRIMLQETVPKLSRMDTAALTVIQQNADQMLQEGDLTFETRLSQGRGAATHTFTACMKRREGIVELTSKTTRIEDASSIASTLMDTSLPSPRKMAVILTTPDERDILRPVTLYKYAISGPEGLSFRIIELMDELTAVAKDKHEWESYITSSMEELTRMEGVDFPSRESILDMTFFRGNGGIWAKFGRQGDYGRNGPMQLSPQELLCMVAIQSAYNLDTSPNRMDLYADKRPLHPTSCGERQLVNRSSIAGPTHNIFYRGYH